MNRIQELRQMTLDSAHLAERRARRSERRPFDATAANLCPDFLGIFLQF
jgi:hypothetical protein